MKDNTKLSNDKEFLKFIKKEIREGYVPLITIKEMDILINKVASWYEFKYPIRYFIDEEFAKNPPKMPTVNTKDVTNTVVNPSKKTTKQIQNKQNSNKRNSGKQKR